MQWTVVGIASGVGADGEGSPLPCLEPTQFHTYQPPPTRASRSSPARKGRGQSWGYPVESRVPECDYREPTGRVSTKPRQDLLS